MLPDDEEQVVAGLRTMLRIRRLEEEVRTLRATGGIVGSVHLGIGQEAIPTGVLGETDRERDVVVATYRGHGWAIACGSDLVIGVEVIDARWLNPFDHLLVESSVRKTGRVSVERLETEIRQVVTGGKLGPLESR